MTPSVETGKDIVGHRFMLKILLIHLPSTRPLTSSLSSHSSSLLLSQVSLLPLHLAHQPASVRDTLAPLALRVASIKVTLAPPALVVSVILLLVAVPAVGALLGALVSLLLLVVSVLLLLLLLYHSHDDSLCGDRYRHCWSPVYVENIVDSSSIHETTYIFLVLALVISTVVPSIIAPPALSAPTSLGKRHLGAASLACGFDKSHLGATGLAGASAAAGGVSATATAAAVPRTR
jgi:hypothetical protein